MNLLEPSLIHAADGNHPVVLRSLVPGYPNRVGELSIFEPLNLVLRKNEMVCLLGPNGAGKSTLLRTIAGLQAPLSGDVLFAGGQNAHSQLAVVLTDPVKVTNMTVRELVTYGRYPYLGWNIRLSDHDRKQVESAIDLVNIRAIATRNINELSDGQRQMVMIARALAVG